MKISIITIGSRGDVQPYIALGRGLQSAGFDVSIVTYSYFKPFVESYGLNLKPLSGDPKEILGSKDGQRWVQSQQNPLKFLRAFIALTKPRIKQLIADAMAVLDDADLVIYSDLGIVGYHVAEYYQTPAIETHLQPFGRTKEFPSVGNPPWLQLGGMSNRISHIMTDQVMWQPFRSMVNDIREEVLGLPRVPFWGPFKQIKERADPMLYAFSEHVLPKPKDWPEWRHVTGYWILPPIKDWQPDDALRAFLHDGPPPVYVGFGSMMDEDPKALVEMILTAVSGANARVILSSGWAGLTSEQLPKYAHVIKSVPHEWLFPQMSAIIHHGGAGTTAAGLRAGVPSMAVPYFADQYFWASRIQKLGAGPKVANRKQLTAVKLQHAIETALTNKTMQRRAKEVSALLQAENGVQTAVQQLEQFMQVSAR